MSDDMASVVVVETSGGDDAANGAGEDDAASMVVVETSGDAANGAGEGDAAAADEAFAKALAAAIDASERREELNTIIFDCTALLKERKQARKGKRGRMRRGEQKFEDDLKHKLERAQQGKLPGDPEPAVPQDKELVQSAARHAQDHA